MNTFAVPNSISTQPGSINAKGEIAGAYVDANGLYHGFLRDKHGTLSTFDVPNALNTYPVSINAKGDITGWYSDAAGTHGFICNRFDFDDDL
jgi:streptogramin lyase